MKLYRQLNLLKSFPSLVKVYKYISFQSDPVKYKGLFFSFFLIDEALCYSEFYWEPVKADQSLKQCQKEIAFTPLLFPLAVNLHTQLH